MKFTKFVFLLLLAVLQVPAVPAAADSGEKKDHEHNSAIYMCPMHPNIKQNEPGSCPVCGMDLVLREEESSENQSSADSTLSRGHGQHSQEQWYTCPMHPNIKQDEPGSCPVCGMDLVAVSSGDSSEGSREFISISQASRRLAGIATEKVQEAVAFQKIHAVGAIDYDEGRISTIAAYVDGRIEKLYANYTGVRVKKNEHLAEFYSPELYSAQVEYLQAGNAMAKMAHSSLSSNQKAFLANAERKLQELGMSPGQIRHLKKTRKARSRLVLDANVSGTVIEKNATEGSYVKSGQVIYKVADLSTVWLLLDMFPGESAFLRFGLKVKARIRSAPDQDFAGRISFISPVIDRRTRTVRVRVEIPNPHGMLKPGDYANATISVPVSKKGKNLAIYDPELAGKFISPMHPQEISDKPGSCPVCGMKLIPAREFGYTANERDLEKVITIPRDSVLSVGKGHVVFVEREKNKFFLREVVTGPVVDENRMVILEGLHPDDVVASSGVFLIDSQMQLSGKTSLMQISTEKKLPKIQGHQH